MTYIATKTHPTSLPVPPTPYPFAPLTSLKHPALFRSRYHLLFIKLFPSIFLQFSPAFCCPLFSLSVEISVQMAYEPFLSSTLHLNRSAYNPRVVLTLLIHAPRHRSLHVSRFTLHLIVHIVTRCPYLYTLS